MRLLRICSRAGITHRLSIAGPAVLAAALLAPAGAAAATITGHAEVTKPYSFTLGDYDVFLLGVDSVEVKQTCTVSGRVWECWAAAQRQLETILSEGEVACESVVEDPSRKRMIALCTLNGEDVGQRFVASGFGLSLAEETSRYSDCPGGRAGRRHRAVAGDVHDAVAMAGTANPSAIGPPGVHRAAH